MADADLNTVPAAASPAPLRGVRGLAALALSLVITAVGAGPAAADAPARTPSPAVSSSLFLDGSAIGDHMIVVGEHGHILVSRDAGSSWTRADVPTHATLTGADLYDTTHGWAVGHDAVILRSRDGGDTWQKVFSAPEQERPLFDVLFLSAEHGFAVGAYGLFLETRDGGDTWNARDIGAGDRHLNQISAASPTRLYIAAEAGNAYRSDDGGQSWLALPSPYGGSFFGTLPVDAQRVYLYGLRGHLFYSDDAGESWQAVETHTRSLLTNGVRLGADRVLFTGMDGMLLTGDASGAALAPIQRPDRLGIAGALLAGGGALVVYGEFGLARVLPRELEAQR